jgi:hypothetical protein
MKTYFQFDIVKWDISGNVLLEKRTLTISRKCRFIAKDFVISKFPKSDGYFVELNDILKK